MATCPICGFRIRDWAPSCPSCGVALEWEQASVEQTWADEEYDYGGYEDEEPYYPSPRTNRLAWPIMGGLVVVLSACVCVFCAGLVIVEILLSEEGPLSVARITRSSSATPSPTPLPLLGSTATWVPAPITSPTTPLNTLEPTVSSPGPSSPSGYSAPQSATNTPASQSHRDADLPTATAIPHPSDTPLQGEAEVIINHIYYGGLVEGVESDEYVEIANVGTGPIDIGGWLLNADDSDQDFIFPSFVLEPWQICRVYTNEHHFDSRGFNFGSPRAIWNNEGDCGYLFDVNREPIATYCY